MKTYNLPDKILNNILSYHSRIDFKCEFIESNRKYLYTLTSCTRDGEILEIGLCKRKRRDLIPLNMYGEFYIPNHDEAFSIDNQDLINVYEKVKTEYDRRLHHFYAKIEEEQERLLYKHLSK